MGDCDRRSLRILKSYASINYSIIIVGHTSEEDTQYANPNLLADEVSVPHPMPLGFWGHVPAHEKRAMGS